MMQKILASQTVVMCVYSSQVRPFTSVQKNSEMPKSKFAFLYIAVDSHHLMLNQEIEDIRKPGYKINALFINRWSPRSMTGEELNDDELMAFFEAARWAPSSYNNQPWRFIYAKRNTESWNRLFDLLVEGNKIWAKNAAALVVLISRKNFVFQSHTSSMWVQPGKIWL